MLNGVADHDKIIAIRFVEWVVALTNIWEFYHLKLKEILDLIFEHFFGEDILVKVTLIEFIIDICSSKWNAEYMMENGFLDKILKEAIESGDVYGMINHRFIVAIAWLYNKLPDQFTITNDYFYFLKANLDSHTTEDRDCVLNALFFILQHKKSLNILTTDPNFISNWLKSSEYGTEDNRRSYFMSLKALLYIPEGCTEDYNDIILRIFSNINSPDNYLTGNGSLKDAIAYVIKYICFPIDSEESKVNYFLLLHELIQWNWGFKELFKNGDFIKYLLDKEKTETKLLYDARNDFVKKVTNSPFFDPSAKLIDSTIAEQLKNYN